MKSDTGIESFRKMVRTHMGPTKLIDASKIEPIDFDRGKEYRYNNSGYIILGLIIEVASGMTYADFVEQRIFMKLGMKNSYYGSTTRVIKNCATGDEPGEDEYTIAPYLSLTLPLTANLIMSCVDDLLIRAQAMENNVLISEKSKQLA